MIGASVPTDDDLKNYNNPNNVNPQPPQAESVAVAEEEKVSVTADGQNITFKDGILTIKKAYDLSADADGNKYFAGLKLGDASGWFDPAQLAVLLEDSDRIQLSKSFSVSSSLVHNCNRERFLEVALGRVASPLYLDCLGSCRLSGLRCLRETCRSRSGTYCARPARASGGTRALPVDLHFQGLLEVLTRLASGPLYLEALRFLIHRKDVVGHADKAFDLNKTSAEGGAKDLQFYGLKMNPSESNRQ